MRILITGFSGFVGRHFLDYLEQNQIEAEILGLARNAPHFSIGDYRYLRCSFCQLDILDRGGVDDVIYRFRPSHILHLAAYSSVGFSWQKPVESFNNNTNVLLNLLEQLRSLDLRCRLLSIGSSEEYGDVGSDSLPLREDAQLRPVSPYAVARVAQEMLSTVYGRGYGLDIVMTRSFNHIGVYQRDAFVVPSLARQLSAIRYKGAAPSVTTGDRTIVRDFVDVRDVARAYFELLMRGKAGEIYNVCSGRGVSIDELIGMMQAYLGTRAEVSTDPKLIRPSDNRTIVGSCAKIRDAVGWEPRISLRESLADILDWWKGQH